MKVMESVGQIANFHSLSPPPRPTRMSESSDNHDAQSGAADCCHVSLPAQHEGTWERPAQSQDPFQSAVPEVSFFPTKASTNDFFFVMLTNLSTSQADD